LSQKDEDILVKFGQMFLSVDDLRQREDVSTKTATSYIFC